MPVEVHTEGGEYTGKAAIQLQRADPQAVAIGDVVLPNKVSAGCFEAKLGMNLVRRQRAGDGVFHAIGHVGVGLAKNNARGRQQPDTRRPTRYGRTVTNTYIQAFTDICGGSYDIAELNG